ncbi:TIR domain protein [Helicobacter pylori]|uniref:toll/interleukin-1 receptor domain-containing protein n=1 Tax=Helicobacter pylori TaxID=210 RepID=UPI0009945A30|nr:toll/interleukin-1 receptor domain-containing protein [Helicobacter pylori]OOP84935.1 TIR domain protein [Helicobacter pylori]PDW76735.1 TIR domain protein [Helicobacter pylori]PDW78078.1 TIR domain protein [Helicobacter pylori]
METYIIDADNIDGDLFFYNLTRNSNDFSMLTVFELDRIAQKIRNILKKHGSRKDIILNHRELQEAFFSPFKPQLKSVQVFLSHSHADRNKALEVKNYLENQTNGKVFIDSLFWDYKDDVLDELAKYDDISKIKDAFTLILRESLQDMIEKCPYFVFLQSKNSVSNQGLSRHQDLLKITYSAWIYEELKIAHSISESRPSPMMESMQVFHDISPFLESFETITLKKLSQQINS